MLVKILTDQNLKVFTNKTGSNFLRGVASSLLQFCDGKGQITADIAVLELDEAHATHFVTQVKPRFSVLLNVMRDQSDRFGDIDNVTQMLAKIAQSTTETVIINREDSRLMSFGAKLDNAKFYGYSDVVKKAFLNSEEQKSVTKLPVAAQLIKTVGNKSTFKLGTETFQVKLKLNGIYNHFNAVGAILAASEVLKKDLNLSRLVKSLAEIEPAFGRGEKFKINNSEVELVLIKNSSGFQMSLHALADEKAEVMIAINDNYADGRDLSWLWDVDFSLLPDRIFATTGSRSEDVRNRLKYDDKKVEHSSSNIDLILQQFLALPAQHKQIYTSYTAMLSIRQRILKYLKKGKHERFN